MRRLFMIFGLIGFAYLAIAQESNIQEIRKYHSQRNSLADGSKQVSKPLERMLHYYDTRTDRNGKLVNGDMFRWKAMQKIKARFESAEQRSYSGDWDFIGPAYHDGYTGIGRVNRLAFHPTDENIIYAATAGGGLWYTPNHGIVWYPMTESLPVNNLSGVAVNYNDPDEMYILTGDGDGCCGGARRYELRKPSIGVLKSTDGGYIWQPTGLVFDEKTVVWSNDLKMHPTIPNILFASTNSGLYRTINGGDDWFEILNEPINEIEFKVGQPSTIFAVDDNNFYRSTNLGITWPDTIPIPAFDGDEERMAITTCLSNPEAIYLIASPGEDTLHRGLYFSSNGGDAFSEVSDTPNVVQNQANYDLCITCNPGDQNDVLIGAVSIWKSENAGVGFAPTGGTHADIHELISNPLNDRLYAATDGGVYFSEDFGDSWTFISEWLRITQYYKIAVSHQDGDVVIGGSQDNGTHRNENGDAVMDRIYGKDGMDCAIHPLNDDLMIVSAQDGEFRISTDGGDTNDSLVHQSSLPSSVESIWVTPVAWDPNNANHIMLGYQPIYRATDGATFTAIADTISGRRILHIGGTGNRVYAGDKYAVNDSTESFHLWSSQDDGASWFPCYSQPTFPDTTLIVSSLTTNPDNAAEVWITLGGWTAGEKVYRSADAGVSWSNMSGSLPNIPVNAIIYQDTDNNPDDAVYIGTDLGVFYRDDNLGDWTYYSNGLPVVEVADLEISYADNTLVAGTHGRGIWESDLFSSCPNSYVLDEFQQFTTLSYFFQAADSIRSTVLIDGFGSSVIYRAGDHVTLADGFRATADNQAFFKAVYGPCDGGIESVVPSTVIEEENQK